MDNLRALQSQHLIGPKSELKVYSIGDFLNLTIPVREDIFSPILQTQSLSMLFARRGVGKTHIALNIAYAVAAGGKFLKWEAPQPRRVIYIDGEMPARAMQDRLAGIKKSTGLEPFADHFRLITPDMQELGMPDLSTLEGQEAIDPFVQTADFIVVDNLSTLARTGKENEAESWLSVQGWALNMRSQKKSVMFVHHAGKGGQQRGTSRREDVLDLVMELRQPSDYQAEEGARFEVHFTKARHLQGDGAKAFEARLDGEKWTHREIEDVQTEQILTLHRDGLSCREIAEETGISKSTVNRTLTKHGKTIKQ